MLKEIQTVLLDLSRGLGHAFANSINLLRSFFFKSNTQSNTEQTNESAKQAISGSSGVEKTNPMNKLFYEDISAEQVLKTVNSRSQQMQMSGPLTQTQKLIQTSQQSNSLHSIEEQDAAKKIISKPLGFNN